MDDIELLKLENKGLRLQNEYLQGAVNELMAHERKVEDELHILRRFRMLVERGADLVKVLPKHLFTEFRAGL